MVAGRGSWSQDQQESAEHQTRARGQLGVEAVLQHRGRPGESGGQGAGVEPRRPVDEEDDGEADQAEEEDDPAEPVAPGHGRHQGQRDGQEPDRDQQVGVGGAGRFDAFERGRGPRQARVARLPDLDPAVIDELGGDEETPGGDDRRADRAFRGQCRTGRGGDPDRPDTGPEQPPFQEGEDPQEEHPDGTQAATDPARPAHSRSRRRGAPGARTAARPGP